MIKPSSKKLFRCFAFALTVLLGVLVLTSPIKAFAETSDTVTMYRLYNPYSGEHFYTSTMKEVGNCVTQGWKYEGEGWTAPSFSGTPVYRLYNPYTGDHHYTTSSDERDEVVAAGWRYEGIGWYSDDNKIAAVYRQYNPYATTGTHNYSGQLSENDYLVSVGWRGEGVAWYATSVPTTAQNLPSNSDKTAASEGLVATDDSVVVYRMYSDDSGEHLYSIDLTEIGKLITEGWKYEGPGWLAPKSSSTPVYRVYNPYSDDHHYTVSSAERDQLVEAGWVDQGISWYSDDAKTVPIYRDYNPNKQTHNHNYTGSKVEHENLIYEGWRAEGIGWYALAVGKSTADSNANNYGSALNYAVVSRSESKAYLYYSDGTLAFSIEAISTGHDWTGTHEVCRKARGLWADGYCEGVNDWWVCFIDVLDSESDVYDGKKVSRYYDDLGAYEGGAGFHYGFSGTGCVVIPNMENAKRLYDFLAIGSKVIVK